MTFPLTDREEEFVEFVRSKLPDDADLSVEVLDVPLSPVQDRMTIRFTLQGMLPVEVYRVSLHGHPKPEEFAGVVATLLQEPSREATPPL